MDKRRRSYVRNLKIRVLEIKSKRTILSVYPVEIPIFRFEWESKRKKKRRDKK